MTRLIAGSHTLAKFGKRTLAAAASAVTIFATLQSPALASTNYVLDLSNAVTVTTGGSVIVKKIECSTTDYCTVIGTQAKGSYNFAFQNTFKLSDWSKQQFKMMPKVYNGYPWVDPGYRDSELDDISCLSNFCVAAGTRQMTIGTPVKNKFKDLQSPIYTNRKQPFSWGAFVNIECLSTSYCVAVGNRWPCSGAEDCTKNPLVVYSGNPRNWTYRNGKVINLRSYYPSSPSAMSCFEVAKCVVFLPFDMESYTTRFFVGDPLKITSSTLLSDDIYVTFSDARCFSYTSCIAIGHEYGTGKPVMYVGDPATWTRSNKVQLTFVAPEIGSKALWPTGNPLPPSPDGEEIYGHIGLSSVSCSSETQCFAVGMDQNRTAIFTTVNPKTDTSADVQQLSLPNSMTRALLTSVSCDSARCLVTGKSNVGVFLLRLNIPVVQ